ncbi:glucoside xylosyltransferase 1-like [Homarus americanus]|uniref:glucoside xylosyltransferase 1-like n=1 Tax=Homarus americanus TaxID=6706 RepID=UPI001C43A722|nr:glucoside xylosyltransferase 1-like [Homarus americanus]
MKCTYRLLVLIGGVFSLLVMLGVTGDFTRILDFRNPSSVSESLRSEVKFGGFNKSVLTTATQVHQQPFKITEHPRTAYKTKLIPSNQEKKDKTVDLKALTPTVVHHEIKNTKKNFQSSVRSTANKMVLAVVCCGDRLNETHIMLKSAAALSHSPLMMIVFTEDPLKPIFEDMYASWPADVRERVSLNLHSIIFPPGQDAAAWRKLFKPCASQRLFMPSLLKDVDALVYVDTDVVFLAPLEELWSHFYKMNSSHMAAMAPEHEDLATGWYNRFAKHPYYGKLGVNSGVMLMNLTRLRKFGWEEYVVPIYRHYKLSITWGDQDIINIIFHYHPDKLYVYGCEYNLRPDHCMYMSVCKAAEKRGVFVLHGNRGTFHSGKQPAFRAVYRAWEEYNLGQDLRQDLYYPMQRYLLKTSNTTCGKIHNAFLKALSSIVRLR